jgi:hypothetical protein
VKGRNEGIYACKYVSVKRGKCGMFGKACNGFIKICKISWTENPHSVYVRFNNNLINFNISHAIN